MRVNPGRMELTVIPNGASSTASVRAQLATAARTVFDTPSPRIGVTTLVDTMFTMRP